ncbi:NAD(P)-binding protein [Pleurotus eryngii]|uniref:NAD(P)-binding protein n=1 Tax=Pleurotus eryngii TaxID=5323 RepID=A0A9P6DHR4_PLEER|nr:NAD(P)-binding protein [Pleurotus eryngii]
MSANAGINIFVTGVTGYVGGAVVGRLLSHPRSSDFRITALVRSPEKAEKLRLLGITPAIGSLDDSDLLHNLCSESDVVLAMADSDHYSSVKAMLEGQKERFETSGKQGIFINTPKSFSRSCLGVLVDDAAGMYQYDTIWNDTNPAQMATLAPTQMHRDVDLMIVEADKEGYVKTYIVLPSTIYGVAQGLLVDLGIANNRSMQIPAIVRASLDRKQGGMVGLGKNVWPNVDIEEQADFFIILLDTALDKPDALGHGADGYYFGESGEHSLYDVGKAVAEALVDLGIGQSREPATFTKDEVDKYFGGSNYLGSNSRCRADHARSLGWNPRKSTTDMLASIRVEVEEEIKASAEGKLRKDQKL